MVRLKFIIRLDSIVLRISEGKERYYRRVNHLLVDNPDMALWNPEKERFGHRAASATKNNKTLERYKNVYVELITQHPELKARQVAAFYKHSHVSLLAETSAIYLSSIEEYLKIVIEREKTKHGTNYLTYDRQFKKCRKLIPDFSHLTFQAINYERCLWLARVFGRHANYKGTVKSFRALLGKADKDMNVRFDIKQIGDFNFLDYDPGKYTEGTSAPDVLSPEQIKQFLNLDVRKITSSYPRYKVALYYNFCLVMFYTFFAPCDVIRLQYKNISKRNTLIIRRKKTCKLVEVPIHPRVSEIIAKYQRMGKPKKDNYILPILTKIKDREYAIKDHPYNAFREKLNKWLKKVGEEMGLDFRLYAYVFRHTAITVAINGGLPLSYVAMLAGSRIDALQHYYYNGNSIDNKERFCNIFSRAGE